MDRPELFGIVLAAGNARRFGSTKQVALFDGTPLVRRAVATAESVCGPSTLLVLGSDWRRVFAACHGMPGFMVLNEDFASGMASSIRSAIRRLGGLASDMLLLLADQPLVDTAHLERLKASRAANPGKIIASAYAGTLGPPVIFPRAFFAELAELSGDSGARPLLEKYRREVISIDCEAAAVDIDLPEDLAAWAKTW